MTTKFVETVDHDISSEEMDVILKRDGCLIVRDAIDHAPIDGLLADLAPYMERKPLGNGDFLGFQTKRLHSLFTKTERVHDFVIHDKVMEMVDLALGPWCDSYQLNSNSITAIGPDETPQQLHRDSALYPMAYPRERNTTATAFWALTDFTEENGATRVIPGSHKWGEDRVPRDDETVGAVMTKGSFCAFLGGIYHGGGRNTTSDEWRVAMLAGFALGWLRQEQNWYLSLTAEEVRKMPEKLARLLGFNLHKPFLGWVQDFQDPYDIIHGYEELSSGGEEQFAEGTDSHTVSPKVKVV